MGLQVLIGECYGCLVVVEELPTRRRASGGTSRWFLCRCICGKDIEVRLDRLRRGRTRSCGCLSVSLRGESRTSTGGGRRLPEYGTWKGMKRRCYQQNARDYANYGGRGIKVCERWKSSFWAFYEDMGSRPSEEHQIDRIDGDGDYEPGNCRWATRAEQNRNRKDNRMLRYRGKVLCLADWAKQYGMRKGTLHDRLARGMSITEALTTPVRQWTRSEPQTARC